MEIAATFFMQYKGTLSFDSKHWVSNGFNLKWSNDWMVFWGTPIFGNLHIHPPSNFSYEMGRTWATVQIASQDFFVQTGGVAPPILYLESCCSWFLSNHHFHFVVVYVELVEASNINSRGQHLIQLKSIIDNYKMFSEFMLVGTLDGKDPTTKCHWEKSC